MRQSNTDEVPVATGALSIFVYGTLRNGHINHDRFCRTALCIEKAIVRGRLYELPSGIPVLQVPDSSVIAVGTSDPLADIETQKRFSREARPKIDRDDECWQAIHGELVVFPDPQLSLPPIDRLEGFRPGLPSLYRRVLIPLLTDSDEWTVVWCYVGGENLCRNLSTTGKTCWP